MLPYYSRLFFIPTAIHFSNFKIFYENDLYIFIKVLIERENTNETISIAEIEKKNLEKDHL